MQRGRGNSQEFSFQKTCVYIHLFILCITFSGKHFRGLNCPEMQQRCVPCGREVTTDPDSLPFIRAVTSGQLLTSPSLHFPTRTYGSSKIEHSVGKVAKRVTSWLTIDLKWLDSIIIVILPKRREKAPLLSSPSFPPPSSPPSLLSWPSLASLLIPVECSLWIRH